MPDSWRQRATSPSSRNGHVPPPRSSAPPGKMEIATMRCRRTASSRTSRDACAAGDRPGLPAVVLTGSQVTFCSCGRLCHRARDLCRWCRVRAQGPPCPGVRPHRRGDRRGRRPAWALTPPASLEVALMIAPGGADWHATFGRLPGARRTKGWYMQSDDRVLAEQLTRLGVPTLLERRYGSVGQRYEAELRAPEVHYSAESGRLRYSVCVGERTMTTLTSEQFGAQLDLLTRLGTLDARANAGPPRASGVLSGDRSGRRRQGQRLKPRPLCRPTPRPASATASAGRR
jgi:hypothetical protein